MHLAAVARIAVAMALATAFESSGVGFPGGVAGLPLQMLGEGELQAQPIPGAAWHYAMEADSWYDFSNSNMLWWSASRTGHPGPYPYNSVGVADSLRGYGKYLAGSASFGSGGVSNNFNTGFRLLAQGKGALLVGKSKFTRTGWAKIVVFGGGYSTGEYGTVLYQPEGNGKFGVRIRFMPDSGVEKAYVTYGLTTMSGEDYEVPSPMRSKNVLTFLSSPEDGVAVASVRLNGGEVVHGIRLGAYGGDVYGDLCQAVERVIGSESGYTRYNKTLFFEFLAFDHIPADLDRIEAALMEKYGITPAQ